MQDEFPSLSAHVIMSVAGWRMPHSQLLLLNDAMPSMTQPFMSSQLLTFHPLISPPPKAAAMVTGVAVTSAEKNTARANNGAQRHGEAMVRLRSANADGIIVLKIVKHIRFVVFVFVCSRVLTSRAKRASTVVSKAEHQTWKRGKPVTMGLCRRGSHRPQSSRRVSTSFVDSMLLAHLVTLVCTCLFCSTLRSGGSCDAHEIVSTESLFMLPPSPFAFFPSPSLLSSGDSGSRIDASLFACCLLPPCCQLSTRRACNAACKPGAVGSREPTARGANN